MIKTIKKLIFYPKRLRELEKTEGHLGLNEGRLLYKITRSLQSDAVIVEIGAFKGKSTCFIAEGIGNKKCRFFSIDTWRNDTMQEGPADVFPDFLENTRSYRDKITVLRGYSYDAVKDWPKDRKIDFLWIDADHSYEGVKRDIEDWLPLVKKNAIVCFHDYRDFPGVKRAIDELLSSGTIKFIKCVGCIYMSKIK